MISTELWRARIGLFNCKRCSSVSSSFSSCRRSHYYNRLRRKHGPGTVVSSSTDCFSLGPPNTSLMAVSSLLSTSSFLLAVRVVMSIAHCTREHTTITKLLDSDGNQASSHSSSSLKTNPASSSTTSITSSDSSTISPCKECSSFSFACLTDKFTLYRVCCSLICDMILSMLVIEIISLLLIICGDVETNPGPVASDRPTFAQLIILKNPDGRDLRIIDWITTFERSQCEDLAYLLLNNDVHVHKLVKISSNEEFVRKVLREWLALDDDDHNCKAVPRTWEDLAMCVTDCGLDGTLAKAIRDTCPQRAHETLSPPPTMKTKSQPADPVTSYAQYLKYRYRQPLPDDDKLPAAPSKYYIELAVIRSENVSRKEADEFTRKTLHGLTEEVMCKKTPIALENILEPGEDGKPVRCVLVEGAPGAGKSTLAWELCHRWEELECVRQYDLVVLVQLRGKRAQEATCLSDLFPKSKVNTEELLASMGNGKGTLLVLDGFDELPHEKHKKDSVYIDLIKGAPDMLPEATVVVTSRPSVSADLFALCKHNIDRHLEVLGFSPEQIEVYARSVFSDGKELEAFLQYINSNPVIKGMMYLPINAVIVASIFKDSYGTGCPYPTTMTQLYDALTRSLIRRYLAEEGMVSADYRMPASFQHREEISKLPENVAKQFLVVAKVAYTGICEEKYVFTDLGVEFDYLGVMKKTTSLDMFGPKCSLSFFHLTLQEYLSALYISLEFHSGLEVSSSISKKNMIIRFLAGLCKHGDQALSHTLDKLFQKNLLTVIGNFELLVVQCVYECAEIVQTIETVRNLFSTKLINVGDSLFHPYSPFDYYLIGHCIKLIGGRWSIRISTKEEVKFLMLGAGSDGHKGEVQVLDIRSSPLLTFDPLLKFFRHDLSCLECHIDQFTDSDVIILQEWISPGSGIRRVKFSLVNKSLLATVFSPSSLESLEFGDCYPVTNTETLNIPSDNSNLKKLKMNISYHRTHDFKQLTPILQKCISLSYLHLVFYSLGNELRPGLVEPHGKQPSPSSDVVGDEHPLTSLVPTLIELLLSNHTLQELAISCRFSSLHRYLHIPVPEKGVKAMVQLVEVAAHSTSLKKLSCDSLLFSQVKSRIPEQYRDILYELNDNF